MALTMDSMHVSVSNIMANEASTETISVQTSSIRADIYSIEYNAVEFDPNTPI